MMSHLLKNSQKSFDALVPALSLFIVMLIGHAWPSAQFQVAPDISFAIVYYWSVFRQEAPLASSFFILGLVEDGLTGVFFGSTSLVWLSIYFITLTQRRFLLGKTFPLVWIGFAFVSLIAYGLKWFLLFYFMEETIPISPILFSYILSVGGYPLFSLGLSLFDRIGKDGKN